MTNAEIVQLQIRVIAIENVLAVLLSEASEHQLQLLRKMSAYISPRPGVTPHRLTSHAAARMINLIDGAGHLQKLRLGPVYGRFTCMKPGGGPTRSSAIRPLTPPCIHEQR